jgi:hypothetical protein
MKIVYNDRDLRSFHVNVSRLTAVREEIGLLFGMTDTAAGSLEEAPVQLTNRIMLNPFAAKRLAGVLDSAINDYEKKYGAIVDKEQGKTVSGIKEMMEGIPSRPELTDEKAGFLFDLVKGLGVQLGIERSFKLFQKTILSDRFLMGFKTDDISGDCNGRLMDVCSLLGMPLDFRPVFSDNITLSNIILFGFEGDGVNRLYKAYLEYGSRFRELTPDKLDPFLLHQGFKWDPVDNRRYSRADYTCFPLFSIEKIMERLNGIYNSGQGRETMEIAEELLKLACEKIGCDEILYLEVSEEDNSRRSFDLNIYRANLKMKDMHPLMKKICRYYSIDDEKFNALYEPVKNRIFGHLSGGIDRHGKDFMTVYFGVKGSSGIPAARP